MTTDNLVTKTTFAPRFFVFSAIGLSVIGWIIYAIFNYISPPKVEWGNLNSSFSAEAVIIRDEQVVTSTNYGTLECLTAEGDFVYEGTAVAELYLSDYSESDIESLIDTQQDIKDYQTSNILKNIVYADLEEINDSIDDLIDEISQLTIEGRYREIPAKDSELKVLLEERRRYMNENLQSDSNLEKYFQKEEVLLEKINSSVTTMYAPSDGIVSFFLDGMETYLNYSFLQNMTSNEYESMKDIISDSYNSADVGQDSKVNINQSVYRIVEPNLWYAVMKISRSKNTLASGQSYMVNFEGYENGYINGYVEFLIDASSDVIVVMKFTEDIGTMATLRTVICNFGDTAEGFKVPREYIEYVDGVYGITVKDSGKNFIPVYVLSQDTTHVIISSADEENPLKSGAEVGEAQLSAVENIRIVKENIRKAAQKAKRDEGEIQLVAVSKTICAEIIKKVYDDGQMVFGESYVQEFLKKQDEIPQIYWHFIGQLQSNKVKYIVNKVSMLHSLDRPSLAAELDKRYKAEDLAVDALVQVNIGGEIQKGGIAPEELFRFLDYVFQLEGINPVGLMCIHPHDEPENCRKYFVEMYKLFQKAIDRGYPMKHLSMGMSGDYVQAVEEGATIVRVGSAIFGHRSY